MRALPLLLCLCAAPAWSAEPPLVRAEQAFDALEFDTAAAAFQEALRVPGTLGERLQAWEGLALARAFMGQSREAQQAFEVLLVLEPQAEVDASLGPKIRAPFEAARRALQGAQRPELTVTRAQDGRVLATLEQPRPVAAELMVAVRQPGAAGFTAAVGAPPGPVAVKVAPERAVEAYAVARDAGGTILFEQGSMRAPLRFDATEAPPPAVVSAQEAVRPAVEEVTRERKRPLWPFVVGGVGLAAAAGVVLGVVLNPPEPLTLPTADRTERLP